MDEEQTLNQAFEAHQAERFSRAKRLYRKLLSANPSHPVALHYMGLLSYQMGDAVQSVDLIKKAVEVKPDYLQAHCNLANTLIEMGRAEEAEKSSRAAIALDADKVNAHHALARALHLQGHHSDAIVSCQTALSLNPNLDSTFETLGHSLRSLERFDEAVENYKKAISINPVNPSYFNTIGETFIQMDQLENAVRSFQKAISLDQESGLLYNNLGTALVMLRNYGPAIQSFENAIALEHDFAMGYQNLANVLRVVGRADEAIEALEKALKIDPDLSSARHNLDALRGETTESAPNEYVEELFDDFANQFETHLQDKLEYKIPSLLKNVMIDKGFTNISYNTVVDMGCGTGLSGVEFKDIADTLIGIDLSKNMIEKAKAKAVYDRLEVNDLINGLNDIDRPIDLFIATDVFVYIGNLQDTFEAVKKSAAPNALFIFSTEHLESDDDFVLQDTSRYAHSKAYIEGLADQFGFTFEHFETTDLRKDKTGWIPGGVYVLRLGSLF